jgi:hypothetical protein
VRKSQHDCLAFFQDDAYVDTYISTIGVDFVSTGLFYR